MTPPGARPYRNGLPSGDDKSFLDGSSREDKSSRASCANGARSGNCDANLTLPERAN